MPALATLQEIQNSPSNPSSPLAEGLSLLFEHSLIVTELLEPQLSQALKALPPLADYVELVDVTLSEITKWHIQSQAQFVAGHPRIGENENLSALSAKEQGAKAVTPTPPEVLERLAHLNACYEATYPGLRYITFVNGRSRAAIAEKMEEALHTPHSFSTTEPVLGDISPIDPSSQDWRSELDRAVYDVGCIAKSRLRALNIS
ncbi:hypothetical protein HYPSUDRAFT_802673 [Hypholoma sublateritium FD-334 SS-4]|uniref:Oxo-4-hydroxy-4-carboxy-5-ureidoimidazoline decarboxylase domain-containing protein n=1 Tax=Hypholoma sublateritium (strain FD-334 SS-4) TaxID=945553 RepID=A0A0D2LK95_HYPSF|nr:hypothetical protein HYPSUDRAFT_802673 [Hypholoma sublateritium FD-334 SS-4]